MIAIVVSEFNDKITNGLLEGCLQAFKKFNFPSKRVKVEYVPGAFELPASVLRLCRNPENQMVIALGCVIKGETDHYDYISQAVTNSIMNLTISSKIPILFGVLTCQNAQLAFDRSDANMKKNKGYEVGQAAIKMIN